MSRRRTSKRKSKRKRGFEEEWLSTTTY